MSDQRKQKDKKASGVASDVDGMVVVCPRCRERLQTNLASVGRKAKCGKCGSKFVIGQSEPEPVKAPPKQPVEPPPFKEKQRQSEQGSVGQESGVQESGNSVAVGSEIPRVSTVRQTKKVTRGQRVTRRSGHWKSWIRLAEHLLICWGPVMAMLAWFVYTPFANYSWFMEAGHLYRNVVWQAVAMDLTDSLIKLCVFGLPWVLVTGPWISRKLTGIRLQSRTTRQGARFLVGSLGGRRGLLRAFTFMIWLGPVVVLLYPLYFRLILLSGRDNQYSLLADLSVVARTIAMLSIPWLLIGGWVGRWLAPKMVAGLVQTVRCPGCGEVYDLVQRNKCGCGFQDHKERHMISSVCPQCGALGGRFDCPRCDATILLL